MPKSSGSQPLSVLLLCGLVVAFSSVTAVSAYSDDLKPEIAEALSSGDTARAVELLHQQIKIDEGYHFNYYVLGLIYARQMKTAQAKEMFQRALDEKSKHWESLYELGLAYIELDELDSAEAAMDRGRKKADKGMRHMFDNGYGLVMLKKGEYQEAEKAFIKARLDHPKNPEYLINLGDAYFYQGVPSLAVGYYEEALQIDTGSTEVYYHWAEACFEMRDYQCAIEKLRVVLNKDSTYANAWRRAGGIYFKAALSTPTYQERVARFKDAIGSYRRFLELSGAEPDSSTVRVFFELAMSYVNLLGFEDAKKYFEAVLSIPYEPRDVYFYYAKSLWGVKDYVKSGEMLLKHQEWVAREGEDATRVDEAEFYQLLGDSYFYRDDKDYVTAISYYLKSLAADPDQKRLLQNVAFAYHTMKSYDQAIEYYDRRIDLGIDSSNASILRNAGYCAFNLAAAEGEGSQDEFEDELEDEDNPGGDYSSGADFYTVATGYLTDYLAYQPSDTNVLAMVANAYLYQLSNCDSGVAYYERLLELDPGNCDALKALGFASFGGVCTKNYSKAARYLRQAYDCISSSQGACADVNLLLWLGQCYHLRAAARAESGEDASDDFRSAFEWYEKCLKCDAGNAECKSGHDEVYLEFGD